MQIRKVSAILLLFFLFLSCNNKNQSGKKESISDISTLQVSDEKHEEFGLPDTGGIATPSRIPQEKQKKGEKKEAMVDWDKKIIKTANLNFELKDFSAYNNSLRDKIRQIGGYIAGEEQTQSEYKIENAMTIKVPVDQFDNTLSLLSEGVEKINEKKVSSRDVTTEIVDTKSRLEAKRQARLRYLDFLKEAKNMEETLHVQSEINGIQEEIESAMGRVEYLNHSATFSTINITYYQVLNLTAKDNGKPSFGIEIKDAFRTGWSWLSELFVGLISIWPVILVILWIGIAFKRSRASKTKAA